MKEHAVTDAVVSIILVGSRKMKLFGKQYLHEDGASPVHEVLSFPVSDPARSEFRNGFVAQEGLLELGDIFICYPEARKIAIKKNRMMDDVVGELAEHGTLHLLGIHHD